MTERLAAAVARGVEGRALLTHPFYQRWESGELDRSEVAEYAVHYRAFEAALPAVLGAVATGLRRDGRIEAAAAVERNLADELAVPAPHLELFDRFAAALPAATAEAPGPAARALVDTYDTLVADGPVAALAALAAYETQASAIAVTKAEGLRRWYGVEGTGTEFWDVHAGMDADHGRWAVEALALLDADPRSVEVSARRAADAWWAVLDERQAAAPVRA
ncbi:MAG: iron-containing redox enzyme family protein [Acidimicrobiales bacterium]